MTRLIRPGGRTYLQFDKSQLVLTKKQGIERREARPSVAHFEWPRYLPRSTRYALSVLLVSMRMTPLLKWLVQAVNHCISIVWWNPTESFRRNMEITYTNWEGTPLRAVRVSEEELLNRFNGAGFGEVAVRSYGVSIVLTGVRSAQP